MLIKNPRARFSRAQALGFGGLFRSGSSGTLAIFAWYFVLQIVCFCYPFHHILWLFFYLFILCSSQVIFISFASHSVKALLGKTICKTSQCTKYINHDMITLGERLLVELRPNCSRRVQEAMSSRQYRKANARSGQRAEGKFEGVACRHTWVMGWRLSFMKAHESPAMHPTQKMPSVSPPPSPHPPTSYHAFTHFS